MTHCYTCPKCGSHIGSKVYCPQCNRGGKGGSQGNDEIYPDFITVPSFSPWEGSLSGDELASLCHRPSHQK